MKTLNRVTLIGRLGKDPEVKSFANGGKVANVSLATEEVWKDKEGNQQQRTDWHQLVFNDGRADVAGKYLRKGSAIYIEGKLRTRKYEQNGQDKYVTEITVNEMIMLDKKEGDAPRTQERTQAPSTKTGTASHAPVDDGMDSDIPF